MMLTHSITMWQQRHAVRYGAIIIVMLMYSVVILRPVQHRIAINTADVQTRYALLRWMQQTDHILRQRVQSSPQALPVTIQHVLAHYRIHEQHVRVEALSSQRVRLHFTAVDVEQALHSLFDIVQRSGAHVHTLNMVMPTLKASARLTVELEH